jgi:hypothetical protein
LLEGVLYMSYITCQIKGGYLYPLDSRSLIELFCKGKSRGGDLYLELQKLQSLYDQGTISKEEYETLKARAISKH